MLSTIVYYGLNLELKQLHNRYVCAFRLLLKILWNVGTYNIINHDRHLFYISTLIHSPIFQPFKLFSGPLVYLFCIRRRGLRKARAHSPAYRRPQGRRRRVAFCSAGWPAEVPNSTRTQLLPQLFTMCQKYHHLFTPHALRWDKSWWHLQ